MNEPRAPLPSSAPARPRPRGNGRVAVVLAGLTLGMLGAAFASVPPLAEIRVGRERPGRVVTGQHEPVRRRGNDASILG